MKQENLSENISFIGGGFRTTLPKCMLCSNFNENSEEMTCKAFPDGIPEDVIFSGYEEECNCLLYTSGCGVDAASGSVQRIEGDNLQEKRSRKEQRRDRQQHYEELETRHDAKALERFKRPAYQSVSVAEYLAKKYDITAEVDTGGQGHFD